MNFVKKYYIMSCLLFSISFTIKAQAPFTTQANLFNQSNTETLGLQAATGTQTFTIFSPTASSDHYSNGACVVAFKGKLYCQWQSSQTDEDSPDTWVAYSTGSNNGTAWTKPMVLAESIEDGHCTSGGWWVNGDTLVAFINVWPDHISPRGGLAYYTTSTDGNSWMPMQRVKMADGSFLNGIFEQDPHALPDGRIINAAHLLPGILAHPIYTDDPSGVRGWKLGTYTNLAHSGDVSREIEPSWFYQSDGDVIMVFRDQNGTYLRLAARSTDRGATWSSALVTNFPDSRSKQSAGNLPDGTAYLVGNPVNTNRRSPLAIATSANGENFNNAYLLRAGGNDLPERMYTGTAKTIGYSYPKSMVYDEHLYVAYTVNKEHVQITRVPILQLNQNCSGAIDACGQCSGGTTGISPCTGYIEAEEACSVDGILLEDKNTGFSGDGYVNADNAVGASATWILNSNSAQTATLSFRYANGGTTSRDGNLLINGVSVGTVSLPSTGAWTNWEMAAINVNLIQGQNEITLSAITSDGLANIDLISFSDGVSNGMCLITGVYEKVDSHLKLFPNPTKGQLELSESVSWKLLNAMGTVIESAEYSNHVDMELYSDGVYFLMVEGKTYKILKN